MLLCVFFKLCLYVSLVFCKGIKFAYVLCKLVVQLCKLLALDFVDFALEYCGLACKVFCVVALGEGYVNIEVLVNALTNNLVLKAGDKSAASKL